jgi:polyisoprenoid-binding protein YceI
MKRLTNLLLIPIAIALVSGFTFIQNTYTLTKDHTVTIHGTSNLHNWDEKVQIVSGDGVVNLDKDGSFDLISIDIKMNVHSIKSDKGSIMDNNTYKALKADVYPEIIFTLTTPVKSIPSANEKSISVKGNLTIAGTTRPVDMQVKIVMQGKGTLSFEGAQTIKMTDYNISPPTALFGTLKTGNEITIDFKTNFTTINN